MRLLSRWQVFLGEVTRLLQWATVDRAKTVICQALDPVQLGLMRQGIVSAWLGSVVLVVILITGFVNPAIALPTDADCPVPAPSLNAISQAQVAQLFDRWNAALQSGKPEAVAANYSEQAILLPTLSSQVRHNRAEITDYFRQFTALKPVGKIEEHNIQIFGDTAIDSGVYSFTGVKDNQPFKVLARYSFVYHQQGDRWLIVEHHSSLLPEPAN